MKIKKRVWVDGVGGPRWVGNGMFLGFSNPPLWSDPSQVLLGREAS